MVCWFTRQGLTQVKKVWTYTRIHRFDTYVTYNKHQEQVMREALSFPRGRHDEGGRIKLTKRQSKLMSYIFSPPVWPFFSILVLLSSNKAFVLCLPCKLLLLQYCYKYYRRKKKLHRDIQNNICPLIKKCYVIREKQKQTEKQRGRRESSDRGEIFKRTKSLTRTVLV